MATITVASAPSGIEVPRILAIDQKYFDSPRRQALTPNRESLLAIGIPGVGYEPGMTLPPLGIRHYLDCVPNNVAVGFQVFNGTKHSLIPLKSDIISGCLLDEVPCVAPGFVELFGVRKNTPFSGTRGTTTWQMGTTNNYLSVGWSVPYNRVLFDNWLMAGVNGEDPQRCFNQMYCKSQTWFQRKRFNEELNGSLKFSVKGYKIAATMDWEYKSMASITVVPHDPDEIADRLYNFAMSDI
ncbi:tereporin-Ca1-like [Tigriopus californicus]|uniref:tereporin-Ca1-like n=1 Tax=Tigriopus californicus TaxID=6832 RepID=UPI0027D9FB87|nr:tereporin-Ca1-like [Tigriopus californicus]